MTALRRYKHWLGGIFSLKHLRKLSVTAGSTWVRLPPEFAHLALLEDLSIQMRIEGGYGSHAAKLPSI